MAARWLAFGALVYALLPGRAAVAQADLPEVERTAQRVRLVYRPIIGQAQDYHLSLAGSLVYNDLNDFDLKAEADFRVAVLGSDAETATLGLHVRSGFYEFLGNRTPLDCVGETLVIKVGRDHCVREVVVDPKLAASRDELDLRTVLIHLATLVDFPNKGLKAASTWSGDIESVDARGNAIRLRTRNECLGEGRIGGRTVLAVRSAGQVPVQGRMGGRDIEGVVAPDLTVEVFADTGEIRQATGTIGALLQPAQGERLFKTVELRDVRAELTSRPASREAEPGEAPAAASP